LGENEGGRGETTDDVTSNAVVIMGLHIRIVYPSRVKQRPELGSGLRGGVERRKSAIPRHTNHGQQPGYQPLERIMLMAGGGSVIKIERWGGEMGVDAMPASCPPKTTQGREPNSCL